MINLSDNKPIKSCLHNCLMQYIAWDSFRNKHDGLSKVQKYFNDSINICAYNLITKEFD